jgi:hypothetical protein
VFTQSTTEGLNYVLNGIKWKNWFHHCEWCDSWTLWELFTIVTGIKNKRCKIEWVRDWWKWIFWTCNLTIVGKGERYRIDYIKHAFYNNGAIMSVQEIGKLQKKMAYYIV